MSAQRLRCSKTAAPPPWEAAADDAAVLAEELARVRAQLAEAQAALERLQAAMGERPQTTPEAGRVVVRDTGGGLPLDDPEPLPRHGAPAPTPDEALDGLLRGGEGLEPYHHGFRRAVGVYVEGADGRIRVYDQLGSCVYSRR